MREVFLTNGKREVLLQEMSFCDGLGWYPQKTIASPTPQVPPESAAHPMFRFVASSGTPPVTKKTIAAGISSE